MIKVIRASWAGDYRVALAFSDGTEGIFDFAVLLAHDTPLAVPLRQVEAFKRFFLELGAVCWPNGLEFSAAGLQRQLRDAGRLRAHQRAA